MERQQRGRSRGEKSNSQYDRAPLKKVAKRFMKFIRELKPLFGTKRRNGIEYAKKYLCGLMQTTSLQGKNMERMEEAVPELDYQGVQQFMSDSPWEWQPVMVEAVRGVDALLGGHLESQLIIDETAFCKKGTESVGVSRQYNGRLGKIDNCQVAVFAALGCGDRASLIGTRLYLPQEWSNDWKRCRKAKIPEENRRFKTKAQLALELIKEQRELGVRFEWTSMDGGYGKDPAFLRALDDAGEKFVADVHCNQKFWLENPWPAMPLPQPPRKRSKRLQAVGEPLTVEAWASAQAPQEWQPMVLRKGTKMELRVEFLHHRIYLWDRKEEIPRLWHLIVRRMIDAAGQAQEVSYSLSNAPADTAPTRLVAQICARHFVERSFQDAKSQLGLADYQLRGWRGWHHHMALVMLAMLFQLRERMLHSDSCPLLSCADVVELLVHFLPRRATTVKEVLQQLHHRHRKRQSAIESAHRRQVAKETIHQTA
jgi:SRSO17 transposase